jgi:hypothetical protein
MNADGMKRQAGCLSYVSRLVLSWGDLNTDLSRGKTYGKVFHFAPKSHFCIHNILTYSYLEKCETVSHFSKASPQASVSLFRHSPWACSEKADEEVNGCPFTTASNPISFNAICGYVGLTRLRL